MTQATAHEECSLLETAAESNGSAIAELFIAHEAELTRFVAANLDTRLAARLDADDVVQDVFLVAFRRFREYARGCSVSFPAWLHAIAVECLADIHRMHLRRRKRSVCCECHEDSPRLWQFLRLQTPVSGRAAEQRFRFT